MNEHVHYYGLRVVEEIGGPYVEIACRCGEELEGREARRRLNATERLTVALRDRLLITPGNETICTWCGSTWAIGSPHEWHDEDCPLYADTLEGK